MFRLAVIRKFDIRKFPRIRYGPIHSSHPALKPGDQLQSQPGACFQSQQNGHLWTGPLLVVAARLLSCSHREHALCPLSPACVVLRWISQPHFGSLPPSLNCGGSRWWCMGWLMQLLLKMSNSAFTILVPLTTVWGDEEAWIQVEFFAFSRPQFSFKTGYSAHQSSPLTL